MSDPSGTGPAQPRVFFGALESMRGLAAFMIVFYHMPAWYEPFTSLAIVRSGHLSVEFFFVLSGFVLFHSFGSRIRDGRALLRFVGSRIGRLYPVHLTFVAAFFAIEVGKWSAAGQRTLDGVVSSSPLHSILRSLGANLLLIQGLGLTRLEVFLNFPGWSISTEFYTYLVFGLAVFFLAGRRFVLFAAALSAGCFGLLLSGWSGLERFDQILRCLGGFFLGCLTCTVYRRLAQRRLARDWSAVLLAGIVVGLSVPWGGPIKLWGLSFPLSALLILSLLLAPSSPTNRLLDSAPLRWLGEMSYSLYMSHAFSLFVAKHAWNALLGHPDRFGGPLAMIVYPATIAFVLLVARITFLAIEDPAKRRAKAAVEAWFPAASRTPALRAELGGTGG